MGMNMTQQEALINFLEKRKELILRLENKRLNKESFLDENYFLIRRFGLKPYMQPKTREECLLNYQYYNCLAKENLRFSLTSKNLKKRKLYDNKAQNYYNEKIKRQKEWLNWRKGLIWKHIISLHLLVGWIMFYLKFIFEAFLLLSYIRWTKK